jgi:hypothetical protein
MVALWMQAALLALLCLGSFARGLSGGFVLDDKYSILRHSVVQGTAPLTEAFRRTFWDEPLGANPPSFRPLTTLSFALDHRLFGQSAAAFHASSLLWYVALVLLGWAFARRCMPRRAALLAMAFFAVMPVHVEVVSSLVGRADTLGALLSLLALLALSPAVVECKTISYGRLVLAALAFSAAMLCKESVVVLPIIVALFVEYRRRGSEASLSFLRAHVPSLVMFATLGVYAVLRYRLQPSIFAFTAPDDVLVGAGLWEKAGYGLELLARYTRLVVAPTGLCTDRKFAEVFRPTEPSLTMAVGAGLLGLGGYVSWRTYRSGGFPFVPAAVLAWLLVSGLVVAIPESMADRFLLLPTLFLCFSLGPALLSLWTRGKVHAPCSWLRWASRGPCRASRHKPGMMKALCWLTPCKSVPTRSTTISATRSTSRSGEKPPRRCGIMRSSPRLEMHFPTRGPTRPGKRNNPCRSTNACTRCRARRARATCCDVALCSKDGHLGRAAGGRLRGLESATRGHYGSPNSRVFSSKVKSSPNRPQRTRVSKSAS